MNANGTYEPYRSFPLQWPPGQKRTPPSERRHGRFKYNLSIADAVQRVKTEIRRLGGTDPVLSTSVEPRHDGWPRSDRRPLGDDHGACLYFLLKGKPVALPSDKHHKIEDNIAALAGFIEAQRTMDRYGIGTIEQSFAGYLQIPGPAGEKHWREEFGFGWDEPVTPQMIHARRKERARQDHPDVAGGSHAKMAAVNAAAERALAEIAA